MLGSRGRAALPGRGSATAPRCAAGAYRAEGWLTSAKRPQELLKQDADFKVRFFPTRAFLQEQLNVGMLTHSKRKEAEEEMP